MDNLVVSIVIPVYNVSALLPQTIKSILAQTYRELELILVDDGSTDCSGKICDEYALKDSRIRVFHKLNGGAGEARNYGVQQASGRWIVFVDGDDIVPETAIEDLLKCNTNDYDITVGTLKINGTRLFNHKRTGELNKNEYLELLLLGKTSRGPYVKLFKKELFEVEWSCPKHITNNEDLLMLISLLPNVKSVFVSNDIVCYNYIYRPGSASKSRGMNVDAWLDLFDKIENIIKDFNDSKVQRAFLNYRLLRLNTVTTIKGYTIDICSERIKRIIAEAQTVNLDKQELRILKILQSVYRQRCLYIFHVLKNCIRKLVKNNKE